MSQILWYIFIIYLLILPTKKFYIKALEICVQMLRIFVAEGFHLWCCSCWLTHFKWLGGSSRAQWLEIRSRGKNNYKLNIYYQAKLSFVRFLISVWQHCFSFTFTCCIFLKLWREETEEYGTTSLSITTLSMMILSMMILSMMILSIMTPA